MRDSDWTKVLGWPGYRVSQSEVNEKAKTLRLWVRRKSLNRKLVCSGCGRRVTEIHEVYQREVRDLPRFDYKTLGGHPKPAIDGHLKTGQRSKHSGR